MSPDCKILLAQVSLRHYTKETEKGKSCMDAADFVFDFYNTSTCSPVELGYKAGIKHKMGEL